MSTSNSNGNSSSSGSGGGGASSTLRTTRRREQGGRFRFASLEALCTSLGATRRIRRVLVANNGLAAVKGIDSMRAWLYEHLGDADAVQFVVMATPEDLKANAEFISMADQHVVVPGGPNSNNYANVDLIMHTALQHMCDAVYPGWGHASENPALPRECARSRRVVFLGPSEEAMFALGDKIASTIVAQSNGVPTVPWSGDHIRLAPGCVSVDAVTYDKAYVTSPEECAEVCARIGFPVMIKASEGGGGKGIRRCSSAAHVRDAFFAVAEEVKGCHIFVMRMLEHVRHLEVQLLADDYGNVIAVRTRDCSVQRRHQKIIEEGPAYGVSAEVTAAMEQSAIALARAVRYRGLGTVEFMYDKATQRFYFLELNPRIQVEHPVSELISGVNLPAALLCVGLGIRLDRIPEVRALYGEAPYDVPATATTTTTADDARADGSTTAVTTNTHNNNNGGGSSIDFVQRRPLPPRGHTIAVRITAEDTDEGFRPTSGRVDEIAFRNSKECWGYFAIGAGGGEVHPYADSQFGHIFSSGATREDARRGMVLALRNLVVRGEIRTSTAYVLELLETPEFCECNVTTDWLDRLIARRAAEQPRPHRSVHAALLAAGIYRAQRFAQANTDKYLGFLGAGHVPSTSYLANDHVESYVHQTQKYTVAVGRVGEAEYALALNGKVVVVPCRVLKSGALQLTAGARTFVAYVTEEPNSLRITIGGRATTFVGDHDPTNLFATVPGRLVRYLVDDGAHVNEDTTFAEVEVMKMVLPLRVGMAGTLHHRAVPGSTVAVGMLLAELTPDDASKVARPRETTETWPLELLVDDRYERPDGVTRAARAATTLWSMLHGLHLREQSMEERLRAALDQLSSLFLSSVTLSSLRLPFLTDYLSTSSSTTATTTATTAAAAAVTEGGNGIASEEASASGVTVATTAVDGNSDISGGGATATATAAVSTSSSSSTSMSTSVVVSTQHGPNEKLRAVFDALIDRYVAVERAFDGRSRQDALERLREEHGPTCEVYERDFVHAQESHHYVIRGVLAYLEHNNVLLKSMQTSLSKLVELHSPYLYGSLLLQTRYLLRQCTLPTLSERKARFARALEEGSVRELVTSSYGYDLLCSIMFDRQLSHLTQVCLELFIRREYFGDSTVNDLDIYKVGAGWYATYRYEYIADATPFGIDGEAAAATMVRSGSTSMLMATTSPAAAAAAPGVSDNNNNEDDSRASEATATPREMGGSGLCMVFADDAALRSTLVRALTDVFAYRACEAPTACTIFFAVAAAATQEEVANVCRRVLVDEEPTAATATTAATAATTTTAAAAAATNNNNSSNSNNNNNNGSNGNASDNNSNNSSSAARRRAALLERHGIDVVYFIVHGMHDGPHVFAFRRESGFVEDTLMRNVLPQSARRLELERLSPNYTVAMYPTPYKDVHVFKATPKPQPSSSSSSSQTTAAAAAAATSILAQRLFARVAVTPHDMGLAPWTEGTEVDAGHMLSKCIAALEVARADTTLRYPPSNHIFVKLIELTFDVARLPQLLAAAAGSYEGKLRALGVSEVELSFALRVPTGLLPMRVLATSATGYDVAVHVYYETNEGGVTRLHRAESAEDVSLFATSLSCDSVSDLLLASPMSPRASISSSSSSSSGGGVTGARVQRMLSKLEALRTLLPSRHGHEGAAMAAAAAATPMQRREQQQQQHDGSSNRNATRPVHVDAHSGSSRRSAFDGNDSDKSEDDKDGDDDVDDADDDSGSGGRRRASSVTTAATASCVLGPYPVLTPTQVKRLQARAAHTMYVHDWPRLLAHIARKDWHTMRQYRGLPRHAVPPCPLRATRLYLDARDRTTLRPAPAAARRDTCGGVGAPAAMTTADIRRARKDAMHALATSTPTTTAVCDAQAHVQHDEDDSNKRSNKRSSEAKDVLDDCGMIVWMVDYAPACYCDVVDAAATSSSAASSSAAPARRRFVLIANDITHQSGSFAVPEDDVFRAASALARRDGVPFVYMSANSGARLGLSAEVKRRFRVAWTAHEAIDYLYLTPDDYAALTRMGVRVEVEAVHVPATGATKTTASSNNSKGSTSKSSMSSSGGAAADATAAAAAADKEELRYRLLGVVGAPGEYLGVENLRGSALIAGEMSRNYSVIPTLSVVSGRSVGIGAYLNRLGRRVIQTGDAPIILTGAAALNRLLGRDVYADNSQLGGRHVMVPNGVTHWNTKHDYASARALLRWLDYVPPVVHPQRCRPRRLTWPVADPIDRDVVYCPAALDERSDGNNESSAAAAAAAAATVVCAAYDPRLLVTGTGPQAPGLFDLGSWSACLEGWAKTVVTGRATLGGLPCGVVLVETRLMRRHVPADPADPASASSFVAQAGQVWFPDSARKTADALDDFARERLPCFVLANWRGFSGGARDMYEEVLKFGASIVDNLRRYTAPVFIYIPCYGELRGGAWVVVDPVINHHGAVEMYCDTTARGGVLEAAGVAEIKFRDEDVRALLRRCEPSLAALDPLTARARETALLPRYRDAAVRFADLHDTHVRMTATGVVRAVVPWRQSRRIFYHKLQRKLCELDVAYDLVDAGAAPDAAAAVCTIVRCYDAAHPAGPAWATDDVAQLAWLRAMREQLVRELRVSREAACDGTAAAAASVSTTAAAREASAAAARVAPLREVSDATATPTQEQQEQHMAALRRALQASAQSCGGVEACLRELFAHDEALARAAAAAVAAPVSASKSAQ